MSALEALDLASPRPGPAVPPQRLAEGLYERHSKRILGFCVRRLATREEAEDAVQTTFLYAIRALQRGVVPVSETAWLFKIAENVCLATHRSNNRRRTRELAESPEIEDRSSMGGDDARDSARELLRALNTLPASQRKALLLREWRGLSYREISAQLGVTVASVETLIFRARRGVVRALNGGTNVRSRVAGVLNLGGVLNAFKTVFGSGAAAAKLAAATTVVTVAALPAGDGLRAATRHTAVAPAVKASSAVPRPRAATSTEQARPRVARRGKAQTSRRAAIAVKVPSKPTGKASQPAPPAASQPAPPAASQTASPAGAPPQGAPRRNGRRVKAHRAGAPTSSSSGSSPGERAQRASGAAAPEPPRAAGFARSDPASHREPARAAHLP